MSPPPKIALHHAGIWVTDFDRMLAFYHSIFDLHESDRGRYENGNRVIFLTLDPNAHHTFVIAEGRPKDAPSTVNQLSFKTETLANVRHYWEVVTAAKVPRILPRSHGNAWSVYFWDPEDNRIEVFCDTPWHVPQPCGEFVDFSKSDEEIYAFTKAQIARLEGGKPFGEWRKETAKSMGREDWPLILD